MNSEKPEPRAEGMRSRDHKPDFPQLALRASKHWLSQKLICKARPVLPEIFCTPKTESMPVPTSSSTDSSFDGQLTDAIAAEANRLGLDLPAAALPGLAAYASRLWAWNERLNLTRHTDAGRFVARDVADAAALCPHLAAGERLLDVGTGGGVPGVLLAVLRPDLAVELSDSVGKRAKAVAAIVQEIGLSLPVHDQPAQQVVAEAAAAGRPFDTLVVRAVAPLAKLLSWFEPLAEAYGRMLVIKGPRWEAEKAEARHRGLLKQLAARRIASWPLPDSDGDSVLLEVSRRERGP
jgi:16S rRNA (guanine527-N7)-methyltransferase